MKFRLRCETLEARENPSGPTPLDPVEPPPSDPTTPTEPAPTEPAPEDPIVDPGTGVPTEPSGG